MKDLEDGFKSFLAPQSDMAPIQSEIAKVNMMDWEQLYVSTE